MQFYGKRQQEEIESLGTGKNFIIAMVFLIKEIPVSQELFLLENKKQYGRGS